MFKWSGEKNSGPLVCTNENRNCKSETTKRKIANHRSRGKTEDDRRQTAKENKTI
jgi:hypothetical protein